MEIQALALRPPPHFDREGIIGLGLANFTKVRAQYDNTSRTRNDAVIGRELTLRIVSRISYHIIFFVVKRKLAQRVGLWNHATSDD